MLEYTATIDHSNPEIEDKYRDKIIYEYTLKEFRKDGFSKEVKVLQADLNPLDRALQAIVLSQYRRKIANKYRKNIKPVVLMKSKTIDESKQIQDEFIGLIKNLKPDNLKKIRENTNDANPLKRAFDYFEKEKITFANLVTEIKEEFAENKCIRINSQEESEENQLLVNSLEDKDNAIRVIFAVDKLNEGWDVLNLFDIVRLYETRDFKSNRPGATTIREAQLIGRGARYCPFQITKEQPIYKRKYDSEPENDLKILEELYYHSRYNPRYIQELTTALKESGIVAASEPKRISIKVKDNFKKTDFWKNGLIFINSKIENNRNRIKSIEDLDITKIYKYRLFGGQVSASAIFEEREHADVEQNSEVRIKEFNSLGKHVIRKAINKLDFYKFDNLKKYFPSSSSVTEFIAHLGNIKIELTSSKLKLDNLTSQDLLAIGVYVLEELRREIERTYVEFIGTKSFKAEKINRMVTDKTIFVSVDESPYSQQ